MPTSEEGGDPTTGWRVCPLLRPLIKREGGSGCVYYPGCFFQASLWPQCFRWFLFMDFQWAVEEIWPGAAELAKIFALSRRLGSRARVIKSRGCCGNCTRAQPLTHPPVLHHTATHKSLCPLLFQCSTWHALLQYMAALQREHFRGALSAPQLAHAPWGGTEARRKVKRSWAN